VPFPTDNLLETEFLNSYAPYLPAFEPKGAWVRGISFQCFSEPVAR